MTVKFRELQRMALKEVLSLLPMTVTANGEEVFKVVSLDSQELTIDSRSLPKVDSQSYTEPEPYKEEPPQPEYIPFYNRAVHKAGDKVRVVNHGRVTIQIVPEIDGDGNMMPKE